MIEFISRLLFGIVQNVLITDQTLPFILYLTTLLYDVMPSDKDLILNDLIHYKRKGIEKLCILGIQYITSYHFIFLSKSILMFENEICALLHYRFLRFASHMFMSIISVIGHAFMKIKFHYNYRSITLFVDANNIINRLTH